MGAVDSSTLSERLGVSWIEPQRPELVASLDRSDPDHRCELVLAVTPSAALDSDRHGPGCRLAAGSSDSALPQSDCAVAVAPGHRSDRWRRRSSPSRGATGADDASGVNGGDRATAHASHQLVAAATSGIVAADAVPGAGHRVDPTRLPAGSHQFPLRRSEFQSHQRRSGDGGQHRRQHPSLGHQASAGDQSTIAAVAGLLPLLQCCR